MVFKLILTEIVSDASGDTLYATWVAVPTPDDRSAIVKTYTFTWKSNIDINQHELNLTWLIWTHLPG